MTNFAFVKFIAHILLFAFFFVAVGTSLFFFWELSQARQSMKIQVSKYENTITLNFTKEEFAHIKWTEKEKEFCYQGRMYDVSSIHSGKNKVVIVCDFDKKETGLRKKLNDLFSNRSDKDFPVRQLVKVLSQKYLSNPYNGIHNSDFFLMLIPSSYKFNLHVFALEMTVPPPRG